MMRFQRCSNSDCLRPFQINEFDGKRFGTHRGHLITCPHCGHAETHPTGNTILIHALSAEEEMEFNRLFPLQPSAA
jgi:hypothetical protein